MIYIRDEKEIAASGIFACGEIAVVDGIEGLTIYGDGNTTACPYLFIDWRRDRKEKGRFAVKTQQE